jgi:uncharacterized protein YbjT (DUF2867 family)
VENEALWRTRARACWPERSLASGTRCRAYARRMNATQAARARDILITGATGYIGRPLAERLAARGHRVRSLARHASLARAAAGTAVEGDALDARSIAAALVPGATLVHLVGTPHPSPAKAASFLSIDLASIRASVAATRTAGAAHLVYVSVAQPAPVMRSYVDARAQGEAAIEAAGITATILRPWYVLGPGHRWPVLLLPLTMLAELFPPTRDAARRLGFVTLSQMVAALVAEVENPPVAGTRRIVDVPAIRSARLQ